MSAGGNEGLRIGVLTTDTAHHPYFLRRLRAELPAGARIAVNLFELKLYPLAQP